MRHVGFRRARAKVPRRVLYALPDTHPSQLLIADTYPSQLLIDFTRSKLSM